MNRKICRKNHKEEKSKSGNLTKDNVTREKSKKTTMKSKKLEKDESEK